MNKSVFVILCFLPIFLFSQEDYTREVNSFIEEWHKNAAEADTVYINKIASNGIYIGTDSSEYWTKNEFVDWSKQYFERGRAWTFTTINRHIYFSDDMDFAWFDELVNTGMGVCRASGVLKREEKGWKILHYHLGITIPNEHVKEIKDIIEEP